VTSDTTVGLPGVVVVLRDSVGKETARTMSTVGGRFLLRPAASGTYKIGTLRIGYRPGEFGPFTVTAQAREPVLLSVGSIPTALGAIQVRGSSTCVDREVGGASLVAVWEQARTALAAAAISASDTQIAVLTTRYVRVTSPRTRRIIRQTQQRQSSQGAKTFVSPLAPDEYARVGYEEKSRDGSTFRAPDADVLLSESFAATHCFGLMADHDASRIGLSFGPYRESDGITDVAGTLWLDRASSELRELAFKFVGGQSDAAREGAGGTITFKRLANGAWVIDRWNLHIPRLALKTNAIVGGIDRPGATTGRAASIQSIAELWDIGSVLTRVSTSGTTTWSADLPTLTGQVIEAETGVSVGGAVVQVEGTDLRETTDSTGHFAFPGMLPGTYTLHVASPLLMALGGDAEVETHVEVPMHGARPIALRLPPLRDAVAKACARQDVVIDAAGKTGMLRGRIRDASGVVAKASVEARWLTSVEVRNSVATNGVAATTTADSAGQFTMCGLPTDRNIVLSARGDNRASDPATIRIPSTTAFTSADVMLNRAATTQATGVAELRGSVRDEAGRGLAAIEVQLLGAGDARTDSLGRYHFGGFAPGEYLLRLRKVGYDAQILTVSAGVGVVSQDVTLKRVQVLDVVNVTDAADPNGYMRRQRSGVGSYLSESQIADRHATTTDQLVRMIPGVRIESKNGRTRVSADHGARSLIEVIHGKDTRCDGVQVLVDRVAVAQPFDPNQIPPGSIKAMEFFDGPATTPIELRTEKTVCGTLAIWTK
jgi:hypothetical protein